jgi:hypothetical protein
MMDPAPFDRQLVSTGSCLLEMFGMSSCAFSKLQNKDPWGQKVVTASKRHTLREEMT